MSTPTSSPGIASRWLQAGLCLTLLAAPVCFAQTLVRHVKVLNAKGAVEIEVEASDRIVPQTQVLTGPDRLVLDFPNSLPSTQLRSQSVNLGVVKDVRVGLFQSKPPVTRVVLDLKSPQSFQVFPYGRTVMIKVSGTPEEAQDASAHIEPIQQEQTRPGLVIANYTTARERIAPQAASRPALDVSFRDGLLTIRANKSTLSEVLFAIQQRTGADISTPAGAEREQVVADLGPAPAQEVIARLLNGSRYNFLILNGARDPRKLDRVILTPRGESVNFAAPPADATAEVGDDESGPDTPVLSHFPPTATPPTRPPTMPGAQIGPPPPAPEEDAPEQQ